MQFLKRAIKNGLKRRLRPWLNSYHERTAEALTPRMTGMLASSSRQGVRVDKGTQILLALKYQELLRDGKPLPAFSEIGFRTYSQFDEDGILLYIFSLIGVAKKLSVEICAGVGYECNTANLIISHGWDGLLFDGDGENVRIGSEFFAVHPDTFWRPPVFVQAWIDAESINDRITENGFSGEIDLLSLDLDGMDFWIWKAITSINPRVVILEFNDAIPADVAVAVPYDREFRYSDEKKGYVGASLAGWVHLARAKGYRLVGRNRNTLNAFFVRDDLGQKILPEVTAASCLDDHITLQKQAARWPDMEKWDWVKL